MTIQPIGDASVALYITPADLSAHGLTAAGLTPERALELTQTAFDEAGITLDGSIEIEAYPDTCGVLVFARVKPPERIWFSFDGLEPLLEAARALPTPAPDASLIWWEDRLWLSLPWCADQCANFISDFGRAESAKLHLAARLAEHGTVIRAEKALTDLLHYFPV